jgi:hypothetical protein
MSSIESGEHSSPTKNLHAPAQARRTDGLIKWSRRLVLGVVAVLSLAAFAGVASADEPTLPGEETSVMISGSPLSVYIGARGQCQSSYLINGLVDGNFFPGGEPYTFSPVADCGFFLAFPKAGAGQPTALQETTFGFHGNAGPTGLSQYQIVSQSPVSGSGTEASPFTETTVFKVVDSAKAEDALVTETTTYVNGAPQFTSTYNVKNTTSNKIYFRAIYAGDLFVNGDDHGTGVFLDGPPRFIGGQNASSGILGGFQEAPAPALPWSSFQELSYPDVWSTIESSVEEEKAFDESIEPEDVDNAAGVEWDQDRTTGLEKGHEQAFTIINRTQVPSPLRVSPVNQTLTQGQTETINVTAVDTAGQPYAGKSVRYTVSGANPQSGAVTLNATGQAQISYVGHNAGIDTTQLYVDLGGSGSQTPSDPAAAATATFVPLPPAPTPNSTYKVQSIKANSNGTVTIVFVPTQGGKAEMVVTVPTGTIASNSATASAAKKAKKCKKTQIKVKGKCLPKTTVSGKVAATGVAGVPLTLTVKPSGKISSALKKGKTVHLTATLTYKSALGGTPTVQTFHVTVKGKKAKKGHKKH